MLYGFGVAAQFEDLVVYNNTPVHERRTLSICYVTYSSEEEPWQKSELVERARKVIDVSQGLPGLVHAEDVT